MTTAYKPIIAKAEFAGHTFEEIRFAQELRLSIKEFSQIIKGERKGTNAKEAMAKLMSNTGKNQNGFCHDCRNCRQYN